MQEAEGATPAQNTGNTLVLGVPGGFVPLNGKPNVPPEQPTEG